MTPSEYKLKLQQFNDTPKYKKEVEFLIKQVDPRRGDNILDYGCGLGRVVDHINENYFSKCCGHDIHNYQERPNPQRFRNEFFFKFRKVFFLHSIAHLADVVGQLERLKELLEADANLYVITPNHLWIKEQPRREYTPDPTVVQHFTPASLIDTFTEAGYKITHIGQFGDLTEGVHERIYLEAINAK